MVTVLALKWEVKSSVVLVKGSALRSGVRDMIHYLYMHDGFVDMLHIYLFPCTHQYLGLFCVSTDLRFP